MDDSPPVVADETVYASTEGGIVGRSKSDGSALVNRLTAPASIVRTGEMKRETGDDSCRRFYAEFRELVLMCAVHNIKHAVKQ